MQWEWYGVHVCACVRACVDVRARVGSCAYAKHRQPTSRFPIIFFSLIPCLYALNLAFTLADAIVLLFVLIISSVFWLSTMTRHYDSSLAIQAAAAAVDVAVRCRCLPLPPPLSLASLASALHPFPFL